MSDVTEGTPASTPDQAEALAEGSDLGPEPLGERRTAIAVQIDVEGSAQDMLRFKSAAATKLDELALLLIRASAPEIYDDGWVTVVTEHVDQRHCSVLYLWVKPL